MLKNLIETAVAIDPTRKVLQYRDDAITIADLVSRARRLAGYLQSTGADHCVYIGVNDPAVPAGLLASILAGVPFTPLNYRLGSEQISELLARISNPLTIAHSDYGEPPVRITPGDWWALGHGDAVVGELGDVADDTIATILLTSGTTSAPKAVPLRHDNLAAYLLNTIEFMGAGERETTLISVPPYHVAGIGAALTNILSGRRIVYLPNFSPQDWLATVRTEKVTTAMLVPTMLARITDHLGDTPMTETPLLNLADGGARTTPDLLATALAAFPNVAFTNAYGLTETASTVGVLGPDDHRQAMAPTATPAEPARLGSVGRAIPGVEFLIRDSDGDPVAPRVSGSLYVRGSQVSGEYLGQQNGLDDDGWFATRDSARLDENRYLFITGPIDDTIIHGAENIAPAEIEDVLTTHPEIRDAAVFGAPDDEWGERVVAAVVATADNSLDETTVRNWVRGRLRSSRTPEEIMFVSELPYRPTGKLLRREVTVHYHADRQPTDTHSA